MADLGNQKIKDTYGRLLQRDPSTGELQDLDGSNPANLVFDRTTFVYDDGNQSAGYVLTSDASGTASWEPSGSGTMYWSANTDGTISNSGFTNVGIGTKDPNKPLTVVGDISGTTDLYLGSTTQTASTITGEEQLIIKGRGADNDWIQLSQDNITFYLDNLSFATFTSPTHPSTTQGIKFNVNNLDLDFSINGDDGTTIFQTEASRNVVRVRDHLTIGNASTVDWDETENWGLVVTGSSLFYSGATLGSYPTAITAVGDISGTTDLYVGQNTFIGGVLHVSGDTFYEGALSGTGDIRTSGDLFATNITASNNLYISGDTHHEGAFSATGSITTSENLYVSGNTFYEGALSGTGDITTVGDMHTTDLVLDGGKVRPAASGGEVIFSNADHGSADWLTLSQDLFVFKFNGVDSCSIDPDDFIINVGNSNQNFRVMTDGGAEVISTIASCDLLALGQSGGTSIGGTTSRWPTSNGAPTSLPLKTLQVNGITTIYSGGTGNLWSADTTALTVIGDISGATDLYVDQDIMVGGALHVSGTTYHEGAFSATGNITTTENLYVSGNTFYEGALSGTGDISSSGALIGGALQVTPTDTSENATHYVTFQKNGNNLTNVTNGFKFNPSTDTLTLGDIGLSIQGENGQVYATNITTTENLYVSGNTFYEGALSGTGDVEIGGNFIADGRANDLELKSEGTTNILLRGRTNQDSYIGGHPSWTGYLGVGTATPNVTLTVKGEISGGTITTSGNILVDGSLNITGNTFYEGALSGSGSISTVGNIYSANHDVLAGSSFKYSDLDDGFYGMPPNAGWSNTSWGNSKTNGASGLGSASQQIGITLPYKAILVGVKGVFRSTETGNYRFALWTAVLADDVATGTWSETITTDNINVLTGGRPFNFSIVDGTTELAAGTQIIPSVFNDTGADNADIFGNYMVIIKRVE